MKISVVIPAYNVEGWIAGAVRSVLLQEPAPHEVIVVDDGSTDSTAAVVSELGAPVKLISQQNRGLAGARNSGIRAATGDVVYLLDADDEAVPGALAEIQGTFKAERDACVVSGNFVRCDPLGNRELAWMDHPEKRVLRRSDAKALLLRNHLSPNSAFKTDVLRKYMFREEMRACEDFDLWLRLILDDVPIVTLGKPLCLYRVGRAGALSTQTLTMRSHRNLVFRRALRDRRLNSVERLIALYQFVRSATGALTAGISLLGRSFAMRTPVGRGEGPVRVLQVTMDEPGGGRTHLRELEAGLKGHVSSAVLELTRGPFGAPRTLIRYRREIRQAIGNARPHIVHAHGLRAAAATLTTRCKVKRVVTIHGLHSMRRSTGVLAPMNRVLNRAVLSRMNRILVLSPSDRTLLTESGVLARDIQGVRTAVRAPVGLKKETARLSLGLDPGAFVILWLGRFDQEKDPITFLAAMRLLHEAGTVAVMAGDGALMPEVKATLRQEGLEHKVLCPGWLPNPDPAFASADIFVSTSLWEGLPLAALESAASGLPLILTDVAGNRDLVERGVPARLVPAQVPERLADELRGAGARSAPNDPRRDSGSWIVEEFSRENLAADVLDAYGAVLGEWKTETVEPRSTRLEHGLESKTEVTWAG